MALGGGCLGRGHRAVCSPCALPRVLSLEPARFTLCARHTARCRCPAGGTPGDGLPLSTQRLPRSGRLCSAHPDNPSRRAPAIGPRGAAGAHHCPLSAPAAQPAPLEAASPELSVAGTQLTEPVAKQCCHMEGLAQGHRWLLVTASFNPVLWGSASLCTPPSRPIPASHFYPPQSSPKGTKHLHPINPQQETSGVSTAQAPQGSAWLGMPVETELGLTAG